MKQTIARATLVVPDYDPAIAFYCGSLGFDLVTDTDMGRAKRWVTVRPKGATGTALLLARADGGNQTAAIGRQTGGRVAFLLHTDDFARDHAAMLAAGVDVRERPRNEPYGIVAVFADPFGNLWDLLKPA